MAEDPHPASDSSALSSREYILYSVFCMLRNPMRTNCKTCEVRTSRKTKNGDCNENKIRYWISVSVSDPNIGTRSEKNEK